VGVKVSASDAADGGLVPEEEQPHEEVLQKRLEVGGENNKTDKHENEKKKEDVEQQIDVAGHKRQGKQVVYDKSEPDEDRPDDEQLERGAVCFVARELVFDGLCFGAARVDRVPHVLLQGRADGKQTGENGNEEAGKKSNTDANGRQKRAHLVLNKDRINGGGEGHTCICAMLLRNLAKRMARAWATGRPRAMPGTAKKRACVSTRPARRARVMPTMRSTPSSNVRASTLTIRRE
jgi:hypothetical protein